MLLIVVRVVGLLLKAGGRPNTELNSFLEEIGKLFMVFEERFFKVSQRICQKAELKCRYGINGIDFDVLPFYEFDRTLRCKSIEARRNPRLGLKIQRSEEST
jgi:hypothetical protein